MRGLHNVLDAIENEKYLAIIIYLNFDVYFKYCSLQNLI